LKKQKRIKTHLIPKQPKKLFKILFFKNLTPKLNQIFSPQFCGSEICARIFPNFVTKLVEFALKKQFPKISRICLSPKKNKTKKKKRGCPQ
jgi:hypothetical protein